ncbi:hypothetical protein BD413DRAFT_607257 [Trametes elegans]|nr:hypothetical protein BD413DRAFT_607257 [Trametes elegans]
MHFTSLILTSLLTFLAPATALPSPEPSEIWQSPYNGALIAPAQDEAIIFGAEFAFEYSISDWCEPGYAPFTVYLTEGVTPPVCANVTADGALADGAFAFSFGKFVVARFGLPQQGVPPPPSLVMPTVEELLVAATTDAKYYLSVVEEFDSCPGHIPVEYGLVSVPISLSIPV